MARTEPQLGVEDLLRVLAPRHERHVAGVLLVHLGACRRLLVAVPGRRVEPAPGLVNIVAGWDSGRPGQHFVFNGHLDTFPAGPPELWTRHPFSGDLERGRLYGRGVSDMKAGITASLFALRVLREFGEDVAGRATATFVCDEETFGEYGARHLLATEPDISAVPVMNDSSSKRLGSLNGVKLLTATGPGEVVPSPTVLKSGVTS